jgi:hypothetical protein
MFIILMVIGAYFIGGYWCLLMVIILVAIVGYYISGYWWVKLVKCNELISLLRSHSDLG